MSIAGLSDFPTSCRMSIRGHPVLARERVDDHLRAGGAVGEVEERPAGRAGAVPGDLRRLVEAGLGELHAGLSTQVFARSANDRLSLPTKTRSSRNVDLVFGDPEALRRMRRHAGLDRARRDARRHAVEVGAGGGGGRRRCSAPSRCVVAVMRTRSMRDAELLRHHLRDLDVEPLPHLGAAVVEVHGAVLVDVHQRAGLVEMGEREADAELHRRQREARASGSARSALKAAISARRAR